MGKAIFFGVAGAIVLVAIASQFEGPQHSAAPLPPAGCEREFADEGADAVTRCETELLVKQADEIHREKMERAAAAAGQ